MSEMRRQLPPLATLLPFEAAYRHRSFTHAADELGLSQASVSRRVRQLELDLGVRLFERQRYSVLPTADCERLLVTVRTSLGELATTADSLRRAGLGLESLTVFSDLSLANALVAPTIGEFHIGFPKVKLFVLSSYEPVESVREDFDIGLQYGRWGEEKFNITPIADDAIFPVCSPSFAERLPTVATPMDIVKCPLLHLADVGRHWPDWRSFLALFRLKEPEPLEGTVFNSYQVCIDVAEKGQGIALGWARSVQSRLDAGALVRIPNMTMPLYDSINVHRPKHKKPSILGDKFVELLRSNIAPVK